MPKTSTFWFTCSWCVFLFGSQRWDTIFGISKFRSCNKMKWLFEIWVQNDIIYLGVEQQCNTLLRHSLDGSHSYYYYSTTVVILLSDTTVKVKESRKLDSTIADTQCWWNYTKRKFVLHFHEFWPLSFASPGPRGTSKKKETWQKCTD